MAGLFGDKSDLLNIGSKIGDFFTGSDQTTESASTLTPEQQAFLNESVLPAAAGAVNAQPAFDQSLIAGVTGQAPSVDPSQFGDTFAGTDVSVLGGQFQQIQERANQAIGSALGGGERFSTGNQIIRGRLAGESAAAQSSLLGQFVANQNQQRQQASQFGQNLSAGVQQGNQSAQLQQFGMQGQLAQSLLNNQTGFNQSLINASLGQATENIVTPGQEGLINPQSVALGTAVFLSDVRLKDETGDVDTGLEEVKMMEGKTWNWKEGVSNDTTEQSGFMAQDLEKIIPNVVKEVNGIKTVDVYAIIPTLVNAIKELSDKVEAIEGV